MAASTSIAPFFDAAIVHEKRSSTADRVAANTLNSEIRIVSPSEYKEAAQCLIEAFADDHVARYAIETPDNTHWTDQQRWEVYKQMFEYITYATCLKGLVTTVGPNYDCVALWNPPGKNVDGLFTLLRSGLWRLHYQLSKEGRERFFKEFIPLLSTSLDEILGDRSAECWYLNYIGTKSGSRGRGYAKKLMLHVTDMVSALEHCQESPNLLQADREGRPTYLESSHEVNIPIYEKFGFKYIKAIYLERDEERVKMDVMVREPIQVKEKTSN